MARCATLEVELAAQDFPQTAGNRWGARGEQGKRMQDDFNSAQTPAGLSTPAVAPQPAQPGQLRVPGQPLGVISANAAQQAQPGSQAQGQTPWWAGKTRPYYGSPSVGTQTELDPQPPAAWPPAAPTHQPPPSGPKPPIY